MNISKLINHIGIITLTMMITQPVIIPISLFKNIPNQQILAVENQKRTALIIGNSKYEEVGTLQNPKNDANDMAKALKELGFDVILVTDANLKTMNNAIDEFHQKLKKGGVGLFFYAGHGLQVEGENYLIPIDAKLAAKGDINYETVPVGKILSKMEDAGNDANIIILDACRNNPFSKRSWNRSLNTRGLAQILAPKGSYISYATAPGDVAGDGEGKNGIFTSHLLKHIKTPNLSIEELFKKVRQGVTQETKQKQIPWDSSSLIGEFSFNPTQTPVTSNQTPTNTPKNPPNTTNNSTRNAGQNLISYTREIDPIMTLSGHNKLVKSVLITPDGKNIISGSYDQTIKIWDVKTGKLLKTFTGHSDDINSLALSKDGKILVSSSGDKTIKIWDLTTGKNVQTIAANNQNIRKIGRTIPGNTYAIVSVAITPDGKTIISDSGNKTNNIHLWDVKTGQLLKTLFRHQSYISTLAVSSDGKILVSGSADQTIKIWDLNTGKLIRKLPDNLHYGVESVAISPDSQIIVSGGRDRTIKVWNLNTGELLRTLTDHTMAVNSVAISADGQTIVSASSDQTIKVWNLATGKLLHTLENHTSFVNSIAISPDGKMIISGGGDNSSNSDNTIKIWQAKP